MKKIESTQKVVDTKLLKKTKNDVFFRDKNDNGENFIYMKYHQQYLISKINDELFF